MLDRRAFIGTTLAAATGFGLIGCTKCDGPAESEGSESRLEAPSLPPVDPDPESAFGVSRTINMHTIDDYLGLPGVNYRDMRLLRDPAQYEDIGGNSLLALVLEGFKITPFPWIGTLAPLPVSGAYEGERLYDIEWKKGSGLEVASAEPRYTQSLQILEEVFPPEEPLILMCGGAGYAAMMRSLLVHLGWDEALVYNAGGGWDYNGSRAIQLISPFDPTECYYWRADLLNLDFTTLVRA